MKRIELKTSYLWALFFLWIAGGQLLAYGVLHGLVPESILGIADAIARVVPSITRLGDNYAFGLSAARRIAALSLAMALLLFFLLLFADVGDSIEGVRQKKKEAKAIAIFFVVGLGMLFAGFGYRVPGFPQKLFYTNGIAYSFLSSLLTYLCTYSLRLAWCLGFGR